MFLPFLFLQFWASVVSLQTRIYIIWILGRMSIFFKCDFGEWEKQDVLSSITELKIFIASWDFFFFLMKPEYLIFLVSSAPGIIGENLIKYVFGLGQKRVLYSVAAFTCHSFAKYGRLMCFNGPARLPVAMSFKLLSIEFVLKYA